MADVIHPGHAHGPTEAHLASPPPAGNTTLVPSLSLFDATAMSVGAIIGAGIFVVVGIATTQAGSALIVSIVIAALMALLSALSIAELIRWLPTEGSSYEIARRLLSPATGFLAGWMYIINNTFTGAAVAIGFAHSLRILIPAVPVAWSASLLCLVFTALNSVGIRQSARLNNVLVVGTLAILALFCALGLRYLTLAHFAPFEPVRWGVVAGASSMFFAFGGSARVAVMAEEVVDARRNVPRAIFLSLLLSTAVYLLVGVVAVGLVGAPRLAAAAAPLSIAIAATGHPFAVYAVSAGGLVAMANVLLTSILGISRMVYAMARRGDLPTQLMAERHATPVFAVWATGLTMALLAAFVDLTKVVTVSTFAMFFGQTITNLCALRLHPVARRHSRMFPLLGLVTSVTFLVAILFIEPLAWGIGVTSLAGGMVYYTGRRIVVSIRRRL
jgi:APA family basic amino acid/polyamine antiporter